MKSISVFFVAIYLLFSFSLSATESDKSTTLPNGCKTRGKFKKILVLPGGGLEAGLQLGIYQGLVEKGWKPDLVISSCGSAIPAALIQNEPSLQAQRDYVLSQRSYDFLKSVKIHPSWEGRKTMANLSALKKSADTNLVPDLYAHHILDIPQTLGFTEFKKPFAENGTRALFVASQLQFDPKDRTKVGKTRGSERLYRQAFFTDPDTAKMLEGYESALSNVPGSSFEAKTETISTEYLNSALRGVISDPFLMEPASIEGKTYLGGAADLYPAEVAKCLVDPDGGQILMSMSHPFKENESIFLRNGFNSDINERRKQVAQMPGIQFIDIADFKDTLKEDLFWPKAKPMGITAFQLKFEAPKDLATFQEKVSRHLDYGRSRALSAIDGYTPNACERLNAYDASEQISGMLISKTGELSFTATFNPKHEDGIFVVKAKNEKNEDSFKLISLRVVKEDNTNGLTLVGSTLNGSKVEAYVRGGKFEKLAFSDFPSETVLFDKTKKSVCEGNTEKLTPHFSNPATSH